MNWSEQHAMWMEQVQKLKTSMSSLTNTDPKNLLQHFFLQAIQHEFARELESHKNTIKDIICLAVEQCQTLDGTARQRAATILKQQFSTFDPILKRVRLADIRNRAVFEVYKQCACTVDTYFERYSSPPGLEEQNIAYLNIAHGNARATAADTVQLSNILVYMQILKRFFVVYDSLTVDVELTPYNLNWIGAIWAYHIQHKSLGDLVWELFVDIWTFEH